MTVPDFLDVAHALTSPRVYVWIAARFIRRWARNTVSGTQPSSRAISTSLKPRECRPRTWLSEVAAAGPTRGLTMPRMDRARGALDARRARSEDRREDAR
ncbi:hypothetical protein ASF38_15770 [Aeromicrobium sp. Leaf272]|nr:hypothetical protein ASF38_15770 [Aeromicrobium sp. Leaf272]